MHWTEMVTLINNAPFPRRMFSTYNIIHRTYTSNIHLLLGCDTKF